MSVLFDNVKPGDTVHYSTPQGQTGKGKVVMNRGTHLVLNAGGRYGRPQVVTDKNYIKHSRDGKVVGALLSRLSQVREDKANIEKHAAWMKKRESEIMKDRSGEAWERVHKQMPGVITRLSARLRGTKLDKSGKYVKEDSHDAEGAAERVAKTKKHKKKLHELNTGTLASYVSKAIADRKKAQGGFEMAGRIWDGERKERAQAKAFARVTKRSIGIKNAVGKIAKAYEETEVNEVAAPGKEEWIKANKARFIAKYGKEKGTKILYAKAWKDSKTNEARENEWAANQALSGQVSKAAKGHYLMRDGRRLSGPHSPEDAVKEYKKMSDSKGVKIVHVKETHQFDVTHELMTEDKVKKAAKLAVDMKKKAKNNKHVDTEPKLDVADKGTGGAMEASSEGGDNAIKL